MSYCVHCGVELADCESKCPLCGTEVLDPKAPNRKGKPLYPPSPVRTQQQVSRPSLLGLLTLIFLIPVLLCIVCDLSVNRQIEWSGYVIGAFFLLYVAIAAPLLLSVKPFRHRAVFSISADILTLLAFLYYIAQKTQGGWFWPFAVPVSLLAGGIICLLIFLAQHTPLSRLAISAIGIVCIGLLCPAIELLLNHVFALRDSLAWSLYPFVTFFLLSAVLLYIDHNKPLKEKLLQKFFI